ncbi:MAG: restriction endonuclease subunit S [Treponema porcinum]|nr:restriction endonuclease subunit S [Treponema porcinum]
MPEGWAWCRLGELFYHTTGKALKKSNNKGSLRKYITTSNLYWNKFDFTEVREMYFTDDELDKCTIKKGDLVLCNGGDVGRAAIWNFDEDICYQNHVSRLRPKIIGINNKLYLYLLMFYKEQGMLNGKGVGITSLSANDLLSGLFPLPPINEQDQIVIKIENIFSQIDYIDDNKSDLQTAINKTKSKILDLAIHGKLVPQDSNDEPAEELLKRIATSDNRPYKKFELVDDSFKIPNGWIATQMGTYIEFTGGAQPPKETFEYNKTANNIRLIQIRDYKTNDFATYIPKNLARRICSESDIMIGRYGPPLFQILRGIEGAYNVALMKAESKVFCKDYLFYMLQDEKLLHFLESLSDRTCGQDGVNMYELKRYPILVPPLAEQQRIVSKIEELFSYLDTISSNLE